VKIERISIYQVKLPLREGSYNWSSGKSVSVFDSIIVSIDTDVGITGWGECCPLGSAYLPAFAAGALAGIHELAPNLIGQDPRDINLVKFEMDRVLKGHSYAKSPIDMACWDILGQFANTPVSTLLGGVQVESFPLYRAVSMESADAMVAKVMRYREEGYSKFQLKVGGDVMEDIERVRRVRESLTGGETLVADANTGWTQHNAIRVASGLAGLDVFIEQPCQSYDECKVVRGMTSLPFILDECIDTVAMLTRAISDRAMDVVNIKISKFGGLSEARIARDLCVAHGIGMTIEDSWGSDIATAAIAHLAATVPVDLLFSTTDFNSYVTVKTAEGMPARNGGRLSAPAGPGLGVSPLQTVLGEPVAVINR